MVFKWFLNGLFKWSVLWHQPRGHVLVLGKQRGEDSQKPESDLATHGAEGDSVGDHNAVDTVSASVQRVYISSQ